MSPTLTPYDFAAKWHKVALKETASYVDHFNDLCRLIGQPTPIEADPKGEWFCFQAPARKPDGSQGFADVWRKDRFIWEYKGKNADLSKAYQQILGYRDALLNPPLLVVSDMVTIEVHTNFNNTVSQTRVIRLDDLLTPDGLAKLRAIFDDPGFFRTTETPDDVTKKAATEFARLAESLRRRGYDPERAAHFLMRLLFCLFAEDIGLLPRGLFTQLVQRNKADPAKFQQRVSALFEAMAHGGDFGVEDIPWFDGGLFADGEALELNAQNLETLAATATLNWASVEPSIFGTLFERSLDPGKRAQLGAHYTSRDDILLIVEPVLMAPLRRRWAEVQAEAQALIERRDAAKAGATRDRATAALNKLLRDFGDELAAVRVLDPACGSGNFLYVALKQLLDLWKEVGLFAATHGSGGLLPWQISPRQLYGIETNPYAHELASVVVWIGYLQWHYENGIQQWPRPLLERLDNIRRMDAILAYDEAGRPVEPAWPPADVIIGNPPFLGDRRMRGELGDEYVNDLRKLYLGRIPESSDLVCYWFEKARALISADSAQRAGLLATNSIRGGSNRAVLDRIKQTGDIFMAWSDRPWILDGAAVRVSMVGFDDGAQTERMLDGQSVPTINSDLTASVDITQAEPLEENAELSFIGTQKSGPFEIDGSLAQTMLSLKGNPNGRPNSDVVKPWVNGSDITDRSRGIWIIDFGSKTSLEDAALYEQPFEYVRHHVKPIRDIVRRKSHRDRWWLFGDTRPGMRDAISALNRYIATPRVSKHRLFAWLEPNVIPDSAVAVIARSDDYFFGVLHSRAHELWALRQGTSLEDRPRYTPTTTFETFPFPWPPGHEPADDPRVEAIADAARDLVTKRDAWLNPEGATPADLKKRTLTNLYNDRPTWLDLAHQRLDRAVLDAYGWPHDLSDDDLLARLLVLNLARAAAQGAPLITADEEVVEE